MMMTKYELYRLEFVTLQKLHILRFSLKTNLLNLGIDMISTDKFKA